MGMAGSGGRRVPYSRGEFGKINPMNKPATTQAEKLKSLREWEVLTKRYPQSSPWGLAVQAATVLSGNITIALLVATEAVLLVAIAMLHSRFVPKESIEKNPMPWSQRLVTFLFGMFWLSCV